MRFPEGLGCKSKCTLATLGWLVACGIGTALLSAPRISANRAGVQQNGAPATTAPASGDSMAGMKMDDMDKEAQQQPQVAQSATGAMAHHHMEMNGHMYMTALRPKNAGDERRADKILSEL